MLKEKAYANVLDIYSDWLISLSYSSNWNVIDIHWPMKKYQEDKRLADSSFFYTKDGIHPNEIGHFIMKTNTFVTWRNRTNQC